MNKKGAMTENFDPFKKASPVKTSDDFAERRADLSDFFTEEELNVTIDIEQDIDELDRLCKIGHRKVPIEKRESLNITGAWKFQCIITDSDNNIIHNELAAFNWDGRGKGAWIIPFEAWKGDMIIGNIIGYLDIGEGMYFKVRDLLRNIGNGEDIESRNEKLREFIAKYNKRHLSRFIKPCKRTVNPKIDRMNLIGGILEHLFGRDVSQPMGRWHQRDTKGKRK